MSEVRALPKTAVLAALTATFGATWWTGADDVAPAVSVSPPGAGSPVTPTEPADLDARYQACAVAAGFDPGGVQVLLWTSEMTATSPAGADVPEAGTPWWVKTGRDVPASIHRPCLVRIGGTDPRGSSHGRPAG